MRTTVNIDDVTYDKVKHLAEVNKGSLGQTITELLEKALEKDYPVDISDDFPSIPSRKKDRKITLEFVNELRDEEGT